jgi:glyoxylase-like metal-dependent hydrolase (beta-lactamase superfamily II)
MEPIFEQIEELDLTVTHLLCTHHHHDHISNNAICKERFDCLIGGHRLERDYYGYLDVELDDRDTLTSGELAIQVLQIRGHTVGQLAFLVNGECVFTGDTLFRGSVGGTCGPGHADFEDIQRSIMDVLMKIPGGTLVYPGHTDSTTIEHEWETNPFIRLWRGVDRINERPCNAFGQPASLLLRSLDYDGGTKCWVRFEEGEKLDIVPGSQVRD